MRLCSKFWFAVLDFVLYAIVQQVSAAATRVALPDGTDTHATIHKNCAAFYSLRDDLQESLFKNNCGDAARRVLRLAFHDAIGYSKSGALEGNGADGSIISFSNIELAYLANMGIDIPVRSLKPFLTRHRSVSAGDLVQFAAAVGLSNCPGAPRLEFLAGRPDATKPASDAMIPSPGYTVKVIINRVADAGLSAEELVYLLASHSIARSSYVDNTLQNAPLDSTPGTFDSQFFLEVLLKGRGFPGNGTSNTFESSSALSAGGKMRLHSDFLLAHDSRTACTWQSMINNQHLMTEGFQRAMAKVAVIGQDKSKLIDCSAAVPMPKPLQKGKNEESAVYPKGRNSGDVQQSCATPFPILPVASEGHSVYKIQ